MRTVPYVLVPFDDLLVRVGVTLVAGESVRVDETSEGVTALPSSDRSDNNRQSNRKITYEISPMRVKLASKIINGHANTSLMKGPSDLDIARSLEELGAGDGSSGDNTRAVFGSSAPCNALA